MIELREHGVAIVHRGIGVHGDETEELFIRNLGTKFTPTIEMSNGYSRCTMEFNAEEIIALAEIIKQLKYKNKQ